MGDFYVPPAALTITMMFLGDKWCGPQDDDDDDDDYKWQVDLGGGVFLDFEAKLSTKFEAAYAKDHLSTVPFDFGEFSYDLDMRKMVQCNTQTKKERPVRRVASISAGGSKKKAKRRKKAPPSGASKTGKSSCVVA